MAWCTRRLPSQEPGPVAGDKHGRTASQHPRRARPEVATGAAASPAVFPSKTPQPAPRAVLRAAVGRSSDSWARRRGPPPTSAASQGIGPQCWVAGSFPITAAGQCRTGHRRRHRLPFQSGGEQPTRTDGPQDSGGNRPGQRQILWMAALPLWHKRSLPEQQAGTGLTAHQDCAVNPLEANWRVGKHLTHSSSDTPVAAP